MLGIRGNRLMRPTVVDELAVAVIDEVVVD